MRITRELMLNHARENAAKLTAKDRGIICIYVTGSLLQEDVFIGGITDIDLICVHNRPPECRREIIRLSHEINLDIAHYEQEEFEPARKLRQNAWIGGWMENVPIVLYDSLRWYDFTRAAATAQFWLPENVHARVNSFLEPARQIWNDLQEETIPQGIKRVTAYLKALQYLANGVAVFSGAPIAERRLLVELPARASAARISGFFSDFVNLYTSGDVTDDNFAEWLQSYGSIFTTLNGAKNPPVSLSTFRRAYYENAIKALYATHPAAAIWLLVSTWTRAAAALQRTDEEYKAWQAICRQLQLDSASLAARYEALDQLIDTAEEALDRISA